MTENEMIECLQEVWENMTIEKDREAYCEMLCLLDNMAYYLRHELGVDYLPETPTIGEGEFYF